MWIATLLLVASPSVRADVSTGHEAAWRRGDAALRALAPWRDCKELAEALGDEEYLESRHPEVRSRPGGGVELTLADEGSGRWAYGVYTFLYLVRGHCEIRGYSIEGPKEAVWGGLRAIAFGDVKPPSLREIAAWDHSMVVDDTSRPELAAARLTMQLTGEHGEPTSDKPTSLPIQPSHPGRPSGSPAAIWTAEALAAAQVADPWLANESDERFDAIAHSPVRPPQLVRSTGRWEIWELRWRARLGGGLLAVYDKKSDRHRWLWATGYDNGAAHFRLGAVVGDRVTLRNVFDGGEYVWELDLRSGACRRSPSAATKAAAESE